jgi:hypothetical protein
VLHHHDHCGGIYTGDSTYKGGVVTEVDPYGNIARSEFIAIPEYVGGGIRVDIQQNIYVGAGVKPAGRSFPEELDGVLTDGGSLSPYWWAGAMYGSLIKYTNKGEKVWEYFGQSPVALSKKDPPNGTHCVCNVSRFDVDRFGRIFLPDAFRYTVVVLDNSSNEILRYKYTSNNIAWGHQIEATDRAFYVADQINKQVVVYKHTYAQEETIDLPVGVETGFLAQRGSDLLKTYPNPFNSKIKIAVSYQLSAISKVKLNIFNTNGKTVKRLTADSRQLTAGITWNPQGLPAGIYVIRLNHNNQVHEKKIILVK